jgi:hypothetical protein
MPLNDSARLAAKPETTAKKLSDGGGLYLFVPPSGSKAWRMNYRFAGKQKTLSFGLYPRVTMADARALRENAKRALAEGLDPAVTKGTKGGYDSFEAIAREWHAAQATFMALLKSCPSRNDSSRLGRKFGCGAHYGARRPHCRPSAPDIPCEG